MLWIDNKTIFHGFISIHERKTQSHKKVRGACNFNYANVSLLVAGRIFRLWKGILRYQRQ